MTNKIILDSCVWIGLCDENDSLREQALDLSKSFPFWNVHVPDYIYSEVLTRLRSKVGINACKVFARALSSLGLVVGLTTLNVLETGSRIFFSRDENLSFTDCMLLAEAKRGRMKVLTFDKVLKKALCELT